VLVEGSEIMWKVVGDQIVVDITETHSCTASDSNNIVCYEHRKLAVNLSAGWLVQTRLSIVANAALKYMYHRPLPRPQFDFHASLAANDTMTFRLERCLVVAGSHEERFDLVDPF
jgi:hypothetical protein